jgi:hypothetical protein
MSDVVNQETEQNQETEKSAKAFTQAELDAAITKAVKTRESNLLKELETRKLEEEGKWKKLYEDERKERERTSLLVETSRILSEHKLNDYLDIFENDHSTIEGRKRTAEAIKNKLSVVIEEEVKKRVTTPQLPKSKEQTPAEIGQMTNEQYAKWRAENFPALTKITHK